jgi:predicted nucleotidyltransferase component of viral defense system
MISEQEISNLANKYKIDKYTILREYLQIVFLKELYSYTESKDIYFKGGTAIHFFLHSFRFSEDLDFTATVAEKNLIKILSIIEKNIDLEIPGVRLNKVVKKTNSLTARINYYVKEINYPITIKLEFSLREKPLTKKVTVLETEYPVIPYPLVVHLSWEEILAEKIRAVLTRAKGRDLFDLWFILSKNIKIDEKMVDSKMKFYNKKFDYNELKKKIENFDEREIFLDLNKFLPVTHRKIIKDLKSLALAKL